MKIYVFEGKRLSNSDYPRLCGGIFFTPAFLLGVWHFCNTQRKNNRVGEETYNAWCPENGGGPREYEGHMGEEWPVEIKLIGLNKDKKYEIPDTPNEVEAEEVTVEAEPVGETMMKDYYRKMHDTLYSLLQLNSAIDNTGVR